MLSMCEMEMLDGVTGSTVFPQEIPLHKSCPSDTFSFDSRKCKLLELQTGASLQRLLSSAFISHRDLDIALEEHSFALTKTNLKPAL